MKKHLHQIASVQQGSIAWECGLEPGDQLASINGHHIQDIFDYQFYIQEEYLDVQIVTKDGEECLLEIEKDEEEDLGIQFSSSLMDEYHSCCNKCIFCFIDQMPAGMRDTLYFKDDDSRLSFLQGNYITLTNMSDQDLDRVIRYHLAPVNISVHTVNPELRCQMLHNRFAGDVMEKIGRLCQAEIPMNSQIVLCKGINDGKELDRSISELGAMQPYMESLSVVPVGLTRFRQGLAPLEAFDREDAGKVLDQIGGWQDHFRKKTGRAFVHASDEWFILAGRDFPPEEYYEGYGQLENGVGMMRLLIDEVRARIQELAVEMAEKMADEDKACSGEKMSDDSSACSVERMSDDSRACSEEKMSDDSRACSGERKLSIATGKLAYPTILMLTGEIMEHFPGLKVQVFCIENHFFGEKITVTGLLTGQDIIDQLKDQELGEGLLLPCNVLKADAPVFLDDVTLEDMGQTLQVPINIIQSEGRDLVDKLVLAAGS